ncbi:MAG: YcfL family protein [Lentisphaeria bacterium]|nr:YcfL family protein [Lentisphaeria bacterium]
MKKIPLFAMVAAAIFFCGCQNTVNTVKRNGLEDSRFITDGFLRDRLELRNIRTARTPEGFLQVQLEVANTRTGWFSQLWSGITGENPYKIHYKFTWFDANGIMIDTILADWQDATIIPGEIFYLTSVSPAENCANFQVSLREADQ